MGDSILLIGGGGREHALAWKLSQSPKIDHIYVAPGNAGTESSGKISNCSLDVKNHAQVSQWCQSKNISLVVVGPEDPLANGLSDDLAQVGIPCFGPCKKAAQIEASKEFAKQFMDRYQIPTARWKSFTDSDQAKNHILNAPYKALVVKASGLAAGKGVIVASCKEEAVKAVDDLKEDKGLASASQTIVIEELLSGEEVSVLCFSDGTTISVMPPAQDHKRLLDEDKGPNTGGMGAYCRCPLVNYEQLEYIKTDILQKTIEGMKKDGTPYVGVLYAGLMMTDDGPKVLEFNCRFGDPETQVLLPLLVSDLYDIMLACVKGTLSSIQVEWSHLKHTVGIVLVSGGYPGSYPKGKVIGGLDSSNEKYIVFHAGTTRSSDKVVTSGGRVLAVVAVGVNLQDAVNLALEGCKVIDFEGKFYRSDIAKKAFRGDQHFEGITYKSAGVDIDSADELVRKIKVLTKETVRPEVCGGIGGFGGIFELSNYDDPYLVSKVSNIGDKLKVAQECSKYESAGYDLVALAVNEILCFGAEPLFFLDTFTCGKLNTKVAAEVITGIARGCKESRCTLIGGETAEMPGMYADGDFDLTAFVRGAVEKSSLLPRKSDICEGDVVIGLHSSSHSSKAISIAKHLMHTQGLAYCDIAPFDNSHTLADVLLSPNVIYVQNLIPLLKKSSIKGMVYLLKDGLAESVSRVLPENYSLVLDMKNLTIPPLYDWLTKHINFSEAELKQNFNFGLDLLLIVDKKIGNDVYQYLEQFYSGKVSFVGNVNKKSVGDSKIQLKNFPFKQQSTVTKKRLAIFTSEKGTNMQALINYASSPTTMSYEVSLVLSLADCENTTKAKELNIPTKVIDSTGHDSPLDLDSTINEVVKLYNIDAICLDEFRKEFSSSFVNIWKGKILNIHSSLLPSFACPDPVNEALCFGARITGCTVYLVEENGNFGRIFKQCALEIEPHATQESLSKNIRRVQQLFYPKVVDVFLSSQKNEDATSKIYATGLENSNKKFHDCVESLMKSTCRPGFEKSSNSGLFDLKASGYHSPYLVSGTDGVGTKLKIAQACDKHDTIGIDLVAMCVNDILTHGAEPLFFMQSFDCGALNPDLALSVISGIVEGCKQANCALVESEINELPDIYFDANKCVQSNENYDVVGYAEGALIKENLLPRSKDIKEGDIVIGVASTGVHSNGFSLVRKIVELKHYSYKDPFPLDKSITIGEALLRPTKIYVKSLLPLMRQNLLKAAAHITGGGLTENIPRVLPNSLKAVLEGDKWEVPPVLQWIAQEGQMSEKEMLKTFNCGIGMALILEKKYENEVLQALRNSGEKAVRIGCVEQLKEGEEKVEVKNFKLSSNLNAVEKVRKKKRVGVLISGTGTNLQALINHTQNPYNCSQAEIVLVVSNVPDVEGLKRAHNALIPTKVLNHKGFKSRAEFDMAVHSLLIEAEVEIVCLAGFMRILTKEFVQLWQGKLLNVHPAILPAFKGVRAHKLALEAGVKITGCTVHFVEPEVDAGAVIEQAAINIEKDDTPEILQEKVKVIERAIFPIALELLASGRISRNQEGKLTRHS